MSELKIITKEGKDFVVRENGEPFNPKEDSEDCWGKATSLGRLYKVSVNYKCGLVKETGEIVAPIKYSRISEIFQDHFAAEKEYAEGYALIKLDGTEVTDYVWHYVHGLYDPKEKLIEVEGKYPCRKGLINTETGEVEVPLKYDRVEQFKNGMACVRINSNWGAVDREGNLVIEPKYDEVFEFVGDFAIARRTIFVPYAEKNGLSKHPGDVLHCGDEYVKTPPKTDSIFGNALHYKKGYILITKQGTELIASPFEIKRLEDDLFESVLECTEHINYWGHHNYHETKVRHRFKICEDCVLVREEIPHQVYWMQNSANTAYYENRKVSRYGLDFEGNEIRNSSIYKRATDALG